MISGEETVRTDSTYSLDIRVETEFRGPMLDSDRGYMTLICSLFFFTIRKEIELLKMMSPFSVMVRISQRVTVII